MSKGHDVHPETSINKVSGCGIDALISHACTAVTGIFGAHGLSKTMVLGYEDDGTYYPEGKTTLRTRESSVANNLQTPSTLSVIFKSCTSMKKVERR